MNHKETERKHKRPVVTHRVAGSGKEAPVPGVEGGVVGGVVGPARHREALSSGSSLAVSSGEGVCCGQVGSP